jgi:copper chaperone CopZ
MKKLLLSAPTIHCDACKKLLSFAFDDLKGVDNISIDLEAKKIQCDYDESRISDAQIIDYLKSETNFTLVRI